MAKVIEEQLKNCGKCGRTTKHHRNNSSTSGFMILIHIILALVTAGLWLLVVIVWKILTMKIGGWKCSECST